MCDFCEKFDFGSASYEVDKYGARIILACGNYRFPEHQQFLFCPKCGAFRLKRTSCLQWKNENVLHIVNQSLLF